MARRKSNLEIPKWYNLQNYEDAKNLDFTGWYEQLYIRYICLTMLRLQLCPPLAYENFIKALNLVRNTPICNIYSNPLIKNQFYSTPDQAMAELEKKRYKNIHGIHSLTISELYELEANIRKDDRKYARSYFQEKEKNAGCGFYKAKHKSRDWFDDPINTLLVNPEIFGATIRIDLNLPDKLLVKQFEKNLRKIRRESCNEKLYKINTRRSMKLSDLVKFAVLPYLDLYIWACENKLKIPNRIMADEIFKTGERGEDDIKTTRAIALSLITYKNLKIFAANAA